MLFTKLHVTTGQLRSGTVILCFEEKHKVNKLMLRKSMFRDKSELDVLMGNLSNTAGLHGDILELGRTEFSDIC